MTRRRKFVRSTTVATKVGGVRVGRCGTKLHRTPSDLIRKYCEAADARLAAHQAQKYNEIDYEA